MDNIIELIMVIIAYGLLGVIALHTFQKHSQALSFWKAILFLIIGLISIQLTVGSFDITVFPIGVVLLFLIRKFRDGNWEKYRRFAWLGFLSNYLVFAALLIAIPINRIVYPEEISTYIADLKKAEIISIHPSAKVDYELDKLAFNNNLNPFAERPVDSGKWFEAVHTLGSNHIEARFPYVLTGIETKWGSGKSPIIYLEKDGKGILISMEDKQLYFRSSVPFLKKKGVIIMYKKIIMFSLLAAVIVFFIYWFYPFKPSAFLSDEQVALEIEEVIFKSNVKQVQDVIKIDEQHFFVPFITENQTYSGSYWEWKRNQWKLNWVKINLRPRVLKIEENNPETYYFVWNLDPRDQVAALDFFLKKKRGYSGTNYHPAIQMKDEISLDTSSYGIRKLPNDWKSMIEEIKTFEATKATNTFNRFIFEHHLRFGWVPYDNHHKVTDINYSLNGSGYSVNNEENFERMFHFSLTDLEIAH